MSPAASRRAAGNGARAASGMLGTTASCGSCTSTAPPVGGHRGRAGGAVGERAGEHHRDAPLLRQPAASERKSGSIAGRTPFSFGPGSSTRRSR